MASAQQDLGRPSHSIEDPPPHHNHPISEITDGDEDLKEEKKKVAKKRVALLDIFRGLTVAMMILVDDAGGEWPVITHTPWNGCNLVMPFFLFIVGMAIPFSQEDSESVSCCEKGDDKDSQVALLGHPLAS